MRILSTCHTGRSTQKNSSDGTFLNQQTWSHQDGSKRHRWKIEDDTLNVVKFLSSFGPTTLHLHFLRQLKNEGVLFWVWNHSVMPSRSPKFAFCGVRIIKTKSHRGKIKSDCGSGRSLRFLCWAWLAEQEVGGQQGQGEDDQPVGDCDHVSSGNSINTHRRFANYKGSESQFPNNVGVF